MLKKFFRIRHKGQKFVYDQAVILNIAFDDEEKKFQKKIAELGAQIEDLLPDKSGVDGSEYGDGEAIVYIYGPSADDIYSNLNSLLNKSKFQRINVTLQYGLPDDPSTLDKKFTI